MINLFLAIAIFLLGLSAFGFFRIRQKQKQLELDTQKTAELTAKKITDAEAKEQDVLTRAREKAIKIIEEARIEERKTLDTIKQDRAELATREKEFTTRVLEVDKLKHAAESEHAKATKELADAELLKAEEVKKLEQISQLNREEALKRLLDALETEKQDVLISRLRKLDQLEAEEIERKAKNILAVAMQRMASSVVSENAISYVELPNEEMKGRIIGREGRNIKAIEYFTGCDLIVDDTPGMITISGFSPIRRQVTKRALERLITDGRIHPGRIEESIEEAKKELQVDIKKAGEDALFKLGISMAEIDPKLVQILGRLKYRTSHGQNALLHSLEVAQFASIIAEELKADVGVCRKGGLFHDIGKAVDHDMQGSHPELGYQIMKKFGFPEEIYYQSISHHEDKPKTLEGVIIKAADALSGARPGARRDSYDLYIKRLEDLERIATSFEGVEKVYAIQAGREIRVFVNPKVIDDLNAYKLAQDLAKRIESELRYPGEVRVTIIREMRVIEYAR